jgi:excisionase family DNA binding protein
MEAAQVDSEETQEPKSAGKFVREFGDTSANVLTASQKYVCSPAPGKPRNLMTTDVFRVRDRGRAHRYREAAQVLNCSERHIIRLVRSGKLKADRLGARVVRIFDDELDRFVASARNGE